MTDDRGNGTRADAVGSPTRRHLGLDHPLRNRRHVGSGLRRLVGRNRTVRPVPRSVGGIRRRPEELPRVRNGIRTERGSPRYVRLLERDRRPRQSHLPRHEGPLPGHRGHGQRSEQLQPTGASGTTAGYAGQLPIGSETGRLQTDARARRALQAAYARRKRRTAVGVAVRVVSDAPGSVRPAHQRRHEVRHSHVRRSHAGTLARHLRQLLGEAEPRLAPGGIPPVLRRVRRPRQHAGHDLRRQREAGHLQRPRPQLSERTRSGPVPGSSAPERLRQFDRGGAGEPAGGAQVLRRPPAGDETAGASLLRHLRSDLDGVPQSHPVARRRGTGARILEATGRGLRRDAGVRVAWPLVRPIRKQGQAERGLQQRLLRQRPVHLDELQAGRARRRVHAHARGGAQHAHALQQRAAVPVRQLHHLRRRGGEHVQRATADADADGAGRLRPRAGLLLEQRDRQHAGDHRPPDDVRGVREDRPRTVGSQRAADAANAAGRVPKIAGSLPRAGDDARRGTEFGMLADSALLRGILRVQIRDRAGRRDRTFAEGVEGRVGRPRGVLGLPARRQQPRPARPAPGRRGRSGDAGTGRRGAEAFRRTGR